MVASDGATVSRDGRQVEGGEVIPTREGTDLSAHHKEGF